MRKLLATAVMLSVASITTLAIAQKGYDPRPVADREPVMVAPAGGSTVVPDARALANDEDVADARRTYRAACSQYESDGFCDCVTAGVAQALMPEEVRIAARSFSDRIPAQGDAYARTDADATDTGVSSAVRIEQVEGHYADACAEFR
jgi:hypothetical protein